MQMAATGNSTHGYFGGGGSPGVTMDKCTYSSETTAAVPGAALSVARRQLAATGPLANALPSGPVIPFGNTPNTGYFGGGRNPSIKSTMDKVTYASDTTAVVPGAALSGPRSHLGATGNSTHGYFGGGINSSYAMDTTMEKVTFASDTPAVVPGAALSLARYHVSATGNSTAGYFGGGFDYTIPGSFSTMDKVTYASDTTAAVPGAALSTVKYGMGTTGNADFGYFGGGWAAAAVSTMEKVTYASDTTAVVPGAALSDTRAYPSATGNSTHGYFGAGYVSSDVTTMDKVTYASDTTAAVPGAALSIARRQLSATGTSTAGYFGGGGPTPFYSTMDKVTYASDTTAAVPGAALSAARYGVAASSARANALPTATSGPVIV
jgi:hypothetical protein